MKKCKKCGEEFYRGGVPIAKGLAHVRIYEDYCESCAKAKSLENKPYCKGCNSYCYKTNNCPVCGKPCCNKCGKMWAYYGYEFYVCSDECYHKHTKEYMGGLYPFMEL